MKKTKNSKTPVLGITGTGGAGKSVFSRRISSSFFN